MFMDIERSLELAAEHLDAGRLDDAQAVCREILQIERDAYALYFLGQIEQRRGSKQSALTFLQEAAELDPENSQFLFEFGRTLWDVGQWEPAARALCSAAELEPDSGAIQMALAAAL